MELHAKQNGSLQVRIINSHQEKQVDNFHNRTARARPLVVVVHDRAEQRGHAIRPYVRTHALWTVPRHGGPRNLLARLLLSTRGPRVPLTGPLAVLG
jgi:hypothetical protein